MIKKEDIISHMRQSAYKPLTFEELVSTLGVEKKDIDSFRILLRELELEGTVVLTRKKRYGFTEKMGLIVGRVQGHPGGFAFLIPEFPGVADVYISAPNLNGAMHNDRVIARYLGPKRGSRPEGEIIRILRRANKTLVGTFEKSKNFGFVVPDEVRIFQDVFVSREDFGGAKNKDKVVVEVTRWPEKRRNPEGKIIEILGRRGSPGVDILSIVRKHNLPQDFPRTVVKEAEKISFEISERDLEGRKDLREVLTVTIDDQDAKDLDDAVSIDELPGGGFRLGVHIADVSYYVREGSELDKEALRRGTSVYLVDRVIPMLPPRLSNGICSLNAGEDRLCLSVIMELDEGGKVQNYEIVPSVIKVKHRMTYHEVRRIIENGEKNREKYGEIVPQLKLMEKLCKLLREHRIRRGALDFDFPESKVILDRNGKPDAIVRKPRTIAEQVIEEFMILANEVVARHMYGLRAPFVYRVHEEPDKEKIGDLNDFLHTFGYHIRSGSEGVEPAQIQKVLFQAAGKPEEVIINRVVLRSMKHARYYPVSLGHFGLASEIYCHFTSPIRRYPDLIIHRIIREYLAKNGKLTSKRRKKLQETVERASERSSERELVAEEAERESVDFKKIEFMQRHIGDEFEGSISSVLSFGFFVELENTVEGLVHVSTLTDDYYQFIEEHRVLVGKHTGKTYRIGDRIRVKVMRADLDAREIDFEVSENPS